MDVFVQSHAIAGGVPFILHSMVTVESPTIVECVSSNAVIVRSPVIKINNVKKYPYTCSYMQ